jgi:hypothetical protein
MLSALRTQDVRLQPREAGYGQLPTTTASAGIRWYQEAMDHPGIRYRIACDRAWRLRCLWPLIGLSSLSDSNVANTNTDDTDSPRRSSGRSGSNSGALAGTTWTGTSNCDDGDNLEMIFKFADSGNPIYEYQTKSGLRSVELTEVGQLIRFVPPGGGVTSITVDSLDVSSDRASHVMSFSTESSGGETLTQSRSRVGTETAIRDEQLEVETTIRSQSVSSQPGIMVPGDEHIGLSRETEAGVRSSRGFTRMNAGLNN